MIIVDECSFLIIAIRSAYRSHSIEIELVTTRIRNSNSTRTKENKSEKEISSTNFSSLLNSDCLFCYAMCAIISMVRVSHNRWCIANKKNLTSSLRRSCVSSLVSLHCKLIYYLSDYIEYMMVSWSEFVSHETISRLPLYSLVFGLGGHLTFPWTDAYGSWWCPAVWFILSNASS